MDTAQSTEKEAPKDTPKPSPSKEENNKVLREKLDMPLESDVSMTAGAIGAWRNAGGELTDRQGDKVFRINPIPWWSE